MSAEERTRVLKQLDSAVLLLAGAMNPGLIPDNGTMMGYALPKARDREDVAAVKGRLRNAGGVVKADEGIWFGADEEIARMILTAMRFDPEIRSAAVIRFDPATIRVCEALFLDICHFDRRKEPPGVQTMEWGIASCCRDGVPDVIYDEGSEGVVAMIRFLGENPVVVANNIIKVSARKS